MSDFLRCTPTLGGRYGSQLHFLPLRRHIFSSRFVSTVAVPQVLDIVFCCTKSGRQISVDSDDREAGNHVSCCQVITVDTLFCLRSTSRCLEALISLPSLCSLSNLAPTWRVLHATKEKKRTSCKLRVEPGLLQTLIYVPGIIFRAFYGSGQISRVGSGRVRSDP